MAYFLICDLLLIKAIRYLFFEVYFSRHPLLLRPNNFFLSTLFRGTSFDIKKVEFSCLYICHQLSAFPNFQLLPHAVKL